MRRFCQIPCASFILELCQPCELQIEYMYLCRYHISYVIYHILYVIRRYHISNLDMTQRVPSLQALSEEKFERIQSLLVIKEWQLYISQNMSKIQVDILSGLFLCHILNMSQSWTMKNGNQGLSKFTEKQTRIL